MIPALPVFLLAAGAAAYIAYKARHVPIPHRRWGRFRAPGTRSLDATTCDLLQGRYEIREGGAFFGSNAVLRWTYTAEGRRRHLRYHLSLFCEKEGAFLVCEGRRLGDTIMLYGYWRQLSGLSTGTVRLRAYTTGLPGAEGPFRFEGVFGKGRERPLLPLVLEGGGGLADVPPFAIIAHRGGARNVDFLPAAENSIGMLLMAARLGATGVEVDIRWTKDGVPVLAHDAFLAFDSAQVNLFAGFIHRHTLAQLRRIRLRKGGRVPTLEEALDAILYRTPLEVVWLDIKDDHDLTQVRTLQAKYMQRAAAMGRSLHIYMGIPDKAVRKRFEALEDHKLLPSLCELEPEDARALNANVWAPQYTGGPQPDAVAAVQAEGRRVFLWSLDDPRMIDYYMSCSPFDGMVTNAAPVLAYWLYTALGEHRAPSVEVPEKRA
ncbi:MAG: glycerophosphodiester phosphodiesterase [Chitinophagaceae bacterium]|nr:MAG: glycerophosphodiester phosphodiesterase [Chitinophagaceae bacterium]